MKMSEEDVARFLVQFDKAREDIHNWPDWMQAAAQEAAARFPTGKLSSKVKLWGAYRHSTWHHYGESAREEHVHLIDADVNAFELARRINAYHARPDVIQSQRGIQYVIPPFKQRSESHYSPGGGGTDYTSYIEIKELPMLNPDECERPNTYSDFICEHGTRGCKFHAEKRKLTKAEQKDFNTTKYTV
jgi:hypothetical protein